MKNHLFSNERINAPHKAVAAVLSETAHTRVASRLKRRQYRSDGPCQTWHVDGFDKLKPYGFGVSGCIDGYSRKLVWLECSFTNNNPTLIASFFIKAIEQEGGTAAHIRTDKGTENTFIAAIQCSLLNDEQSHSFGTSQSNQRIEQFWSFFRPSIVDFYINLFKDLIAYGSFTPGNAMQTEVLRFAFMSLIRKALQNCLHNWNTHRMRKNTSINFAGGQPEIIHTTNVSFKRHVADQQLSIFKQRYPYLPMKCANGLFEEYLEHVCQVNNISANPRTPQEGITLYHILSQVVQL